MKKFNQFETVKNIQKYWVNQMIENTEKTSKLPFYNINHYKPSNKTLARLKESVKRIKIIPLL